MKATSQLARSPLHKWTALLFVLIIAGFGFIQATHVHDMLAKQGPATGHCPQCVVAHSAAVITHTSSAPTPSLNSAVVAPSEPQVRSRLRVPAAFIRPPPQDI